MATKEFISERCSGYNESAITCAAQIYSGIIPLFSHRQSSIELRSIWGLDWFSIIAKPFRAAIVGALWEYLRPFIIKLAPNYGHALENWNLVFNPNFQKILEYLRELKKVLFQTHFSLYSKGTFFLTLYCLAWHICDAVPNFWFKKGSSKNFLWASRLWVGRRKEPIN